MTLNELGARCLGWKQNEVYGGWLESFGSSRMVDAPDITPSDPPTKDQVYNIWRLKERAVLLDPCGYADAVEERVKIATGFDLKSKGHIMMAVNWQVSLEQECTAAIDVLCPAEHREGWEAMKEAVA